MNLTQAMSAAPAVVSFLGKRYTAEELHPKMIGGHAAVFNDVGMTKDETKGAWQVV